MTTAIIGIGNLGATVARQLASGGEPVVLSATSQAKTKKLAAEIGGAASAALNNRDAVQRADNVVLALWLDPMREVIDEVADLLPGKVVVDPSNPIRVAADGTFTRTLPEGQSSGELGNKVREGIRLNRGNHAWVEFTSNPKPRGSVLRNRRYEGGNRGRAPHPDSGVRSGACRRGCESGANRSWWRPTPLWRIEWPARRSRRGVVACKPSGADFGSRKVTRR